MKLTPMVDFTNIFARLFPTNKMRGFFWQMAFGKCKTDLANGAIIWQISPAAWVNFSSKV